MERKSFTTLDNYLCYKINHTVKKSQVCARCVSGQEVDRRWLVIGGWLVGWLVVGGLSICVKTAVGSVIRGRSVVGGQWFCNTPSTSWLLKTYLYYATVQIF